MSTRPIQTELAPAAIGPYSQGIVAGGLLFTAGQIPLDPATGEMVNGGVAEQTTRVLANLTAVLSAAGATWSNVVKTTIFLADLGDFSTVNEVYAQHLGSARPARSTVEVAALPRGALVEIEAVAYVGG
ncbi:MAG TPA: RidA family protein [Gemmatimonadaceae bacterium]|nr:RidA family protein [Gemmatimonadaceae bacterium]